MQKYTLRSSLTNTSRFLLISLTIDAIFGATTAYTRRKRLQVMTKGLDLKGVYGPTLGWIKEQGAEKTRLRMAALIWLSFTVVITTR